MLCGYTATPDDTQVQRTAMGTAELVPWVWRKDTDAAIDELRKSGVPVIALETARSATPTHEFSFPRSGVALLLGNERHGLAPALLVRCDGIVKLPSIGVKNSLNVAVALGMCAHEIARQWSAPAARGEVEREAAEAREHAARYHVTGASKVLSQESLYRNYL